MIDLLDGNILKGEATKFVANLLTENIDEVSEEKVKYLVDNVNSLKEDFGSVYGVEITTDSINESFDGLSLLWNTLGGAYKISKANETIADMNTNLIKSLFQTQINSKVSYSKETVLANTIYHQGGEK